MTSTPTPTPAPPPAADCAIIDVGCQVEEVAGSIWTSTRDAITSDVSDGVAEVLSLLGTMWVRVPTPDLGTGGAPSGSAAAAPTPAVASNLTTALSYVSWISGVAAVVGLIILAVMIATRMRSGDGVPLHGRLLAVLAGGVLVSGATSIASAILPTSPAASTNTATFLQSSTWWLVAVGVAVSITVGGARMAWEQRARPGRDLLKSILTLVVVAGSGLTFVWLLVEAGDSFSTWILEESLECRIAAESSCFKDEVSTMLALSPASAATGSPEAGKAAALGNGLVIGLVVGLVSVVQVMLMIVRSGMLVILAGILPLAASATNTDMGRSWFQRCISWLTAFVLYKPAAAIVYAAGFRMSGEVGDGEDTSADDLLTSLTGLTVLVLAVFALPALMRFVAPMVGAMASSAGASQIHQGVTEALPAGAARRGQGRQGDLGQARPSVRSGPRGAVSAGGVAPRDASSSTPRAGGVTAVKNTASSASINAAGAVVGGTVAGALTVARRTAQATRAVPAIAVAVAEHATAERDEPTGGR